MAREITDLRQAAPTYQVFETTAGHADLADCETDLAQDREEVFYRLTLAAERAHLFMASYDRAQRLVTVASYELSSLGGLPL